MIDRACHERAIAIGALDQRRAARRRREARAGTMSASVPPRRTSMPRIMVDAGHGGTSKVGNSTAFGSRGPMGTLEKDITLDIARRVVARLGGQAELTRQRDDNMSLGARAHHAARDGADVFVSIHANSGPPEAQGAETFVHPGAGAESRALAAGIQHSLDRLAGRLGGRAGRGREGRMAILDPRLLGSRTAACLVEVDYLSNPRSEQRLRNPAERAAIGDAIAGAIRDHLGSARRYGRGEAEAYAEAARDRSEPMIIPDIDYNVTSLSEANRKWAEFFGRYERWRAGVSQENYRYFPHAAICQLKLSGPGGSGYGTGFYIGPETILTCGHNFKHAGSITQRVLVQPAYTGVSCLFGEKEFAIPDVSRVVSPNWWSSEDPEWDLAVFQVPGLPAPAGQYFQLPNSTPASGQFILSGYGKIRGTDYDAQGQYMDGITVEEIQATPSGWYLPIMGIPGHSGSPVFHEDTVVGVFTRMTGPKGNFDPSYNFAVRLEPQRLDWITGPH
jgi:N-acetylmuramoyl-L-alanine amidase